MSDKAVLQSSEVISAPAFHATIEGGFSLMLNLHGLSEYCKYYGGRTLYSTWLKQRLTTIAVLFGDSEIIEKETPRTQLAFDDWFRRRGGVPDAELLMESTFGKAQRICRNLDKSQCIIPEDCTIVKLDTAEDTIRRILAMWRLTECDPLFFVSICDRLCGTVAEVSIILRKEVENVLAETAKNFFFVGEEADVPFDIARTLYQLQLGKTKAVISLYEQSVRLFGKHHVTFFNMGLAYKSANMWPEAIDAFNKCLAQEPSYDLAREEIERVCERLQSLGLPQLVCAGNMREESVDSESVKLNHTNAVCK